MEGDQTEQGLADMHRLADMSVMVAMRTFVGSIGEAGRMAWQIEGLGRSAAGRKRVPAPGHETASRIVP